MLVVAIVVVDQGDKILIPALHPPAHTTILGEQAPWREVIPIRVRQLPGPGPGGIGRLVEGQGCPWVPDAEFGEELR